MEVLPHKQGLGWLVCLLLLRWKLVDYQVAAGFEDEDLP